MPDINFEQFYRDTATLTWPPAGEIARRGRARRRRQRIVAVLGAATVAVGVAAAAAAMGGGTGPAPVPPASPPVSAPVSPATPSPSSPAPSTSASSPPASLTQVPLAAMLQPADIGPGTWTVTEEANGDWTAYFALSLCAAEPNGQGGTDIHTRERTIHRDATDVAQRVLAYTPGGSAAQLARLRAKVSVCGSFTSKYGGGEQFTVRIVRDGFASAADESFVLEVRSGGGVTRHAFVRRGVLVTEVLVVPNTEAETVRVGRAAADRLARAGA